MTLYESSVGFWEKQTRELALSEPMSESEPVVEAAAERKLRIANAMSADVMRRLEYAKTLTSRQIEKNYNESNFDAIAACQAGTGVDPELFFSDNKEKQADAKAVCAKCLVSELCLSAALRQDEGLGRLDRKNSGIWGGMTVHERNLLRNRNKRRNA